MSSEKPQLLEDLEELVLLNKHLPKEEITRSLYSLIYEKGYTDSFSDVISISLKFKFRHNKPLKHDLAQQLLKLVEEIGGKNSIVYFNMNYFDDEE